MIERDFEFTADDQRQIDRLVDGTLDEVERRELLASFDERPGAWRRCALVFLEAQCWRDELRHFARAPAAASADARHAVIDDLPAHLPGADCVRSEMSSISSSWRGSYAGLFLAMAASFFLALGLTWLVQRGAETRSLVGNPPEANRMLADAGGIATSNFTEQDLLEGNFAWSDRWDTVTLVMDDGSAAGQRQIELPVVESIDDDSAWLDQAEPVVPRELREALERLGHRVEERRQLLPVALEDGRQVIVPVDEVEFTPIDNETYQ